MCMDRTTIHTYTYERTCSGLHSLEKETDRNCVWLSGNTYIVVFHLALLWSILGSSVGIPLPVKAHANSGSGDFLFMYKIITSKTSKDHGKAVSFSLSLSCNTVSIVLLPPRLGATFMFELYLTFLLFWLAAKSERVTCYIYGGFTPYSCAREFHQV